MDDDMVTMSKDDVEVKHNIIEKRERVLYMDNPAVVSANSMVFPGPRIKKLASLIDSLQNSVCWCPGPALGVYEPYCACDMRNIIRDHAIKEFDEILLKTKVTPNE